MKTVAHYVINYVGASWMADMIESMRTFRSLTFTWTSNIQPSEAQASQFFQVLPPVGGGTVEKAMLAVGFLWERGLRGVSRRVVRQMAAENVELIHAHFGRSGYYALPLIKRYPVPLLTSFYGYDISEYPTSHPAWRKRYQELFEKGSYFLVEGNHMRQTMIDLGCPPEKAILQRLGIDLNKVPFNPRQWQPGTPLNVLQVCRVREKKGIPDSIRAFAKLHREFPDARFTLIGDVNSKAAKPIMTIVHSEVQQLSLGDVIQFFDILPYETYLKKLNDAHIFIHPSVVARNGDTEGGAPVTLIEASASGMMIVASQHCDIPEVIKDGESGLLAPEGAVDQLGAHLLTLAGNPDRWEQMAMVGRAHVEENYDLEKQLKMLEAFYHQVIDEAV